MTITLKPCAALTLRTPQTPTKETAMTKLPPVSAPINEADDNVHTSADDNVHTGSVEYIGNNVISTDAPTKLTDMMFFGVVKGW